MKNTLTRIKRLRRKYQRFVINYGIPLFIVGFCWDTYKGYMQGSMENQYHIQEQIENSKKQRIISDLLVDVNQLKAWSAYHLCTHSRDDCVMSYDPLPFKPESCIVPEWTTLIRRKLLDLPVLDNICVEGVDY